MNKFLMFAAAGLFIIGTPFGADAWMYQNPQMGWCLPAQAGGSYYGSCQIGSQHVFAPYTYVNTSPTIYASASASAYAYPYMSSSYQMQTSSYTYPNQQMYGYLYPQYQTSYSEPNYYQPNYQPMNYYQPTSNYQNYGYSSYPSYASSYMSGDEYCYSGYGCYPFPVDDPHQWIYDHWTGTWY